jgi:hypothetical protein
LTLHDGLGDVIRVFIRAIRGARNIGSVFQFKCETFGEYVIAEQIRQILVQEQDHQIDLATWLGGEVSDLGGGPMARTMRERR